MLLTHFFLFQEDQLIYTLNLSKYQWQEIFALNVISNDFRMTLKMVSLTVRYLFYQSMDEKIKTQTLNFSAKENPNMEKALFNWPIVQQYAVKAKNRLISRKFSGMKFFHLSVRRVNEPKATCACVCSINQSNHFISVHLFFLFCLYR